MGSADRRSPIKQKPLRQPGQGLDEDFQRILHEDAGSYISVAVVVVIFSIVEWIRYWVRGRFHPVVISTVAIAFLCLALWKMIRFRKQLHNLHLGSEGEKAVGQMLEQLRADGFRVFHDVPGDGFNLDHVLVGPQGVFTVETKTISKPPRGSVEVVFDGEKITVNGWTPDRNPVTQSLAQSKWLHDMLQSSTGHSFWVQPVVVYPGWYVRETTADTRVWVLNPDRLRGKIQRLPERLRPEEVALIADRIVLHVRNQEKR